MFGCIIFAVLILSPLAEAGYKCSVCGGDGWLDSLDEFCPMCGGDGCCEPGDDGYYEEYDDGSCGEGSGGDSGDCCGFVYWTSGIAFLGIGLALWKGRTNHH